MHQSYLTHLRTDEATAHRIMNAVAEMLDPEDMAVALFAEPDGRWVVELHFAHEPDVAHLRELIGWIAGQRTARALTVATVAPRDWVAASLRELKPVSAGRFVVHGRHDRAHIAPNRIAIEVEAALAFGTGHHATTRACLLALDALVKRQRKWPVWNAVRFNAAHLSPLGRDRPRLWRGRVRGNNLIESHSPPHPTPLPHGEREQAAFAAAACSNATAKTQRILDLGTGSGVLAMAAARTLRRSVLASDIDRTAALIARNNVRHNRAAPWVTTMQADGVTAPSVRARAPYDLIFANILLAPLKRLAAPVVRLLAPGGRVILSGLLTSQGNAALASYRAHGLVLERRVELAGWTTLVMIRPMS